MANTPVETIKEKLDVVDFLKQYLQLQPSGRNYKALCPFHREKTASFMISPERQTWHCFGCNIGGDVFTFVMRYENVEFSEALRILAEKAGVELKRVNPAEYKYLGLLYEINDAAAKFFKQELGRSDVAKKYLAERGLSEETVEEFEIGFAPNPAAMGGAGPAEALTLHLIKAGFYPDDILRAGLSFKTERGMKFDRFRARIMFPIHNHLGKIVGFTGRVLPQFDDGKSGKYVNSPETPIFNKSKLLYGFFKSKNSIRDLKSAFLVEGQMDFLMSWQAGVRNVVASSGTALTEDHLRTLRRLADQLIVSFDNDDAGWEAGERAVDLAEAYDFDVKAAIFKDYKDPADAVFAGKENLLSAIKNAKPAVEFYFEKYLPAEKFDVRHRDSLKNLRMVLEKIKNIQSPVARTSWMKELSKRTGVDDKVLFEEMEKLASKKEYTSRKSEEEAEQATAKKFSRWELLAQRCLASALSRESMDNSEEYFSYLPGQYREIFAVLQNGKRRSEDPILDELINFIVFQQKEAGFEEFEELKRQLYKEYLKERRQELVDAVRQAEHSGDDRLHQAAIQELDKLPSNP